MFHMTYFGYVNITAGPFARPLSAHFSYVKFIQQRFMTICILNFKSYIVTKVKIILLEDIFVFKNIDYYQSYGRSGNFWHWGWCIKCPFMAWRIDDRDSVSMIEDILGYIRTHFKMFCNWKFGGKIDVKLLTLL